MTKINFSGIFTVFFLVALTVNVFAQKPNDTPMNDYNKDWEAINKLEQDGLTKSALKKTQDLYDKIQKDKDNPATTAQTIKALLFINKYQARLEEDGLVKAIYRFQQEIEKSESPVKPILQSMVAEMYDRYLNQHLYKFRDRTNVDDYKLEDIRTWSVERITQQCYDLYQASISNEATQKVNIDDFSAITYSGRNVEGLRPTLYDFLAHRALDFFVSGKYYLTKPAFKYYLEEESDFADAQTFANRTLTAKDSLSAKFQAMQVFQDAIAFHLEDKDPKALIDLDLKRLKFVMSNSILNNKKTLYLERLEKLLEKYKDNEAAAEISHKIALHYYNQGKKYSPSPTDKYRWDIKKAYEICQKAAEKHPKSYGASHCKNLMNTIENKMMSLKVEKVNPTGQNLLALLSYKNMKKVYFKAIPVTNNQLDKFKEKYGEKRVKYLNSLSGAYKWDLDLKDEGDFQEHSLEFFIPKLSKGRYIIAASANKNFTYEKNGIAHADFYVSNITITHRRVEGKHEFYLTDRVSGQPLADVTAELFVRTYNSILRKYSYKKVLTKQTDEKGYINTEELEGKTSRYSNSFYLKLTTKEDELYLDDSYYNYNNTAPYERQKTHFFLDRAIYRPGQTVYFKGLVLSQMTDGKNPQIVPNESRTITFYDANRQKVTSVQVTTNEYGSFNGSFTTPSSGLTGQMSIEDGNNNDRKYFRVEEYKRPKFEVEPSPIKTSFKINDSVTVKGVAKAYAGSNIDGAKVQYRVVRKAQFPYWNWRWGWYIPFNQEQQEIALGETKTDENGEYEITFKAIPDRSIPKDKNPIFRYTVYVDVTDITGETHSTQSVVRVGYIGLDISLRIPSNVEKESAKPFEIVSRNLNYEYEPSKGTVVIEQLKTPEVVFSSRFWDKPDYFSMDSATFKKRFPYYAYQNEDKKEFWPVAKEAMNITFDTEEAEEIALDDIQNWPQGKYKLTLQTEDKFGNPIELTEFFTVYGKKDKTTPLNDALFVGKQSFYRTEPGETITLDIGSYDKEAYVLYEIEHDNQIVERKWLQPNGRQSLDIKVEEKHRGNLHFHLTTVQNGRFYTKGGTIYVPWSNKDLSIEYQTFRNKLYPGDKEEWKIKISGPKGDKVSAELLASMYDASLDAFAANYWGFSVHPTNYRRLSLSGYNNFNDLSSSLINRNWNDYYSPESRGYKNFNWNGFSFYEHAYYEGAVTGASGGRGKGRRRMKKSIAPSPKADAMMMDDAVVKEEEAAPSPEPEPTSEEKPKPSKDKPTDQAADKPEEGGDNFDDVKVRTNLNETVFFYPDLMTDKDGNVIIKFTMNEALTRWKFMLMGHTKSLQSVIETKEVVTQKDLMVMPNAPRFFRQNDEIHYTAKVSNLTENTLKGSAKLLLFDAISMEPIDAAFGNTKATIEFEAKGGQSDGLSWKLNIPDDWNTPVIHRVVAKAGDFSDGEESALPVLSNRMMVTETQPLPIRGKQKKKFVFKSMKEASKSSTLKHHKLTLEFTQNPAWYAIQSLPYLMEYPYECTEQIFSRYYANSLASDVANSHPKIKRVFDQWKNIDTDALKSNLSKNQELKYALLEETPWVLQAQSEEQQKKNVGLLFDLNRMGNELTKARDKMADRQLANGGFSWFPGGRDSWYISQYIVEGMGHLKQLGVKDLEEDPKMKQMVAKAVSYIDDELAIHYKELLRRAKRSDDEKEYLKRDHLSHTVIHYLYARYFFLDQAVNNKTTQKAIAYYEGQAKKYWRNKSMYMQGLLALGLHRKGEDKETPQKVVAAAKENALNDEERGMYWKYPSGYYWYQLPIETHALMIELFDVVAQDKQAVDDLKVWLLKAKQTTHWKTTKATASACYSLLMTGDNWLLDDKEIVIKIGGKKLDQSKIKKEAGTGYFKTTWEGKEITDKMANISVKNPNDVVAWGAMYWQYFENLDKIKHFKETPLKLNKKLFKQINTDRGPVLKPIEKQDLEPGDLVKVRIELTVDRSMEYVHMKDMRAAGFEPVNVLSQYKYQGGLGYYESTRDASTNFFFSYLSKGTYVFEYPLRVNHKGDFSNGITTIQCMYAPEFTAHSEGVRVKID